MGRNGAKSEVKVVASQRDWELLLEEQVLIKEVEKVTNKQVCLVPSSHVYTDNFGLPRQRI